MHPPDKENAATHGANQRAADSKNPQHETTTNYHSEQSLLGGSKAKISPFDSALVCALDLASQGIPSFPCREDKAPACPHGFKDASADPEILKAIWAQYPGYLVGVPTGGVSGFDVLDIDPKNGGMEWLEKHRDNLRGRIHQTRSGGFHYCVKSHKGLRNSTSKIAAGVDVRAEGGYIIWWPAAGLPIISDVHPALWLWPDWLLTAAMAPPQKKAQKKTTPKSVKTAKSRTTFTVHNISSRYVHAALKQAVHTVATAPEGSRNDTLNRQAFSLLRLVESGKLGVRDIANALAAAALAAGLEEREVIATLTSAIRARGIA